MKRLLLILMLLPAFAWADSEIRDAGSYDQGTNWTNPSNITGPGGGSCASYLNTSQDIITVHDFSFSSVEPAALNLISPAGFIVCNKIQ